MFTKQHYEVIAGVIAGLAPPNMDIYDDIGLSLDSVILAFSKAFGQDNPHFDIAKFWKACYGETHSLT